MFGARQRAGRPRHFVDAVRAVESRRGHRSTERTPRAMPTRQNDVRTNTFLSSPSEDAAMRTLRMAVISSDERSNATAMPVYGRVL